MREKRTVQCALEECTYTACAKNGMYLTGIEKELQRGENLKWIEIARQRVVEQ